MTSLALVLALASAPEAHAQLAGKTTAIWGDLSGGLGVAGAWDLARSAADPTRVHAGGSWSIGMGALVGKFDDAFAIGRGTGFGLRARQDLLPTPGGLAMQTTVGLEAWRAIDLLVVSLRVGAFAGPLLGAPRAGASLPLVRGGTARVLGSAAYRFHRTWQVQLRVEAGVDLVDIAGLRPLPAIGVLAGIGFAVPVKGRSTR